MSRQYITTAIDYPNAAPHMGQGNIVKEKPAVSLSRTLFSLSGVAPALGPGRATHSFATVFE